MRLFVVIGYYSLPLLMYFNQGQHVIYCANCGSIAVVVEQDHLQTSLREVFVNNGTKLCLVRLVDYPE